MKCNHFHLYYHLNVWGQNDIFYLFIKNEYFIQQGSIKLITSDSKDFYIDAKDFK